MSDNVRLWMGAFKSMSVTERGYGTCLAIGIDSQVSHVVAMEKVAE